VGICTISSMFDFEIVAVYALIALALLAFVREWTSPDLVALGIMAVILLFGLLPVRNVVEDGQLVQRGLLSVFANGAPITIASMFVLSGAMEYTGVIDSVGRFFRHTAGKSELRALVVLISIAAVLSAFVNNTPVVVFLLPIVLGHARSAGLPSSRLLIPLSYAAILGGACTLTGTSTNLIVAGIAEEHEMRPFGMFELTKLGVVFVFVGFVYLLLVGRRLLPATASLDDEDNGRNGEFLTQFEMAEDSAWLGKALGDTLLEEVPRASVHEIRRGGRRLREPIEDMELQEGDEMLATLPVSAFGKLRKKSGLRFRGRDTTRTRKGCNWWKASSGAARF